MIVTITINTFALFTSTAQHLPHCHCIVSNMFRITNSLLSHHDRSHRHHLHNHNNCHHHHLCLGQSLIRFISEAQDLPHCHTEAPNVWLMAELLRRSHFHKEYFPHDENKQQNVWGVSNCKCYRVGAIHCPRPSRRNDVPQDNDGEGKTFSNLKGFINVINLGKSGEKISLINWVQRENLFLNRLRGTPQHSHRPFFWIRLQIVLKLDKCQWTRVQWALLKIYDVKGMFPILKVKYQFGPFEWGQSLPL